jgi:uncharacterized protein (UPF0332 family)
MSFNWQGYFDLSQELLQNTGNLTIREARARSAISRAYYAAFCSSRNHLRDVDGKSVPQGAEVHKYVKTEFANSTEVSRQQISKNLDRLRIERNKADYDDVVKSLDSTTGFSLELCRKVLTNLAHL